MITKITEYITQYWSVTGMFSQGFALLSADQILSTKVISARLLCLNYEFLKSYRSILHERLVQCY